MSIIVEKSLRENFGGNIDILTTLAFVLNVHHSFAVIDDP